MNGKKEEILMPTKSITLYAVCLAMLVIPGSLLAGNLSIIEQRLTELDQINKRIVRDTTVLPARGVVKLKARVYDRPTSPLFIIINKEFTETKEGVFPFQKSGRHS